MNRAAMVVNGKLLTVSTLEARARGETYQAILIARLRDAVTGAAATGPTTVVGTAAGLSARAATDGYVGLVGRPSRAFPALASQPYSFHVRFEVEGYARRVEEVTLAQDLTFPGTFSAAELGPLSLHRTSQRVEVSACEIDLAGARVPLAGATVIVDQSSDRIQQPPIATTLLGIAPGLSRPRPNGSAVRAPILTPAPDPERRLTAGVAPGAEVVEVDNRGGFAVGDLVVLDGDTERAEWIEVSAVDGPTDPLAAAVLTLRHPPRNAHQGEGLVRRVPAPGLGPTVCTLTRDALEGDRTLAVSSLAALATGRVLQIMGGTHAAEYGSAALYRATTNTDGIARLPAASGLAAVRVRAVAGSLNASGLVTLTQASPVRRLELTLE